MGKFYKDLKQYFNYVIYSARSELKSEVANSFLGCIWWLLDPVLLMFVYMFIGKVVFNSAVQYYPIFVFIGISCWSFFSKTISAAVRLLHANRQIISKVYIPKHMLLLSKMFVLGFKLLISFGLVIILMVVYQVPLSWSYFAAIPILIILFTVTFGIGLIVMHYGVFVTDLQNIISVVLRLVMYLSGTFYSIENKLGRINQLLAAVVLKVNPMALIMADMRAALLSTGSLHWVSLSCWFALGIIICIIGIRLIYKHENSYVKII